MFLAAAGLQDLTHWARGSGLEIILLVTGALLVGRLTTWIGARVTRRIDERSQEDDALVRTEMSKHRHALAQVITWTALVLVYLSAGILVLQRLNLPISGLVAPATIIGVALGFGAQRIVADLLAGFFMIAEHQYGYGDVIRVSPPGTTAGVEGTVEEVTLRITRLRTLGGEVLTLPNGEIRQVTNLSRDWARAVIDVPVPSGSDMDVVTETLERVNHDAFDDDDLRALLLDRPTLMGVQSIGAGYLTVRVVARTLPGKQFDVGRRLRSRIAAALQGRGIHVSLLDDSSEI